jgi:hypothetical protein
MFLRALNEFMKEESDKGEKMRERDKRELGGKSDAPKPPEKPPVVPRSGGGPPIQNP